MYRRMKYHVKIGFFILIFSFLVTIIFGGILLWLISSLDVKEVNAGGFYTLSSLDYSHILANGGSLRFDPGKVLGGASYQANVVATLLQNLMPISLVFMIALFLLSIGLWLSLKHLQNQNMLCIAEQMDEVMKENTTVEDVALTATYNRLNAKFEEHLNDYKRLNAYLSHEQKNAVAILRAKMELTGHTDDLHKLDEISNNFDDILTLSEHVDKSTMAVVDVSLIGAEVYDNYRKIAKNIQFDFDGDEDTEIMARSRWVYRAIANLLDNAIKYGEGKPIIFSIRAIKNSVIVSVKDHGIGIRDEKQEDIFQDRYRINPLNKDGYGIGLSLVSHVCDLCGGYVTVESEIDKGSTFYMSFPQIDILN